jgi:endonuclease III
MPRERQPARPSTTEVRRISAALRRRYGERRNRRDRGSMLDALVATILSQNTSDANSSRAFESLKARFATWDEVRAAPAVQVARAIRSGGLARVKTRRIRAILRQIYRVRGQTSLEHLRRATNEQIREALCGYTGVGPKTAACVLLFHLGRADFPVDTHVHRIARRLGWIAPRATAEQAYEHLLSRMPETLRYELHVNLVALGRELCRARRPSCYECPVRSACDTGRKAP